MIYVNELKDLYLYNKPLLLPRDRKNKRKGNLVYLLTPHIESSISILNHPLMSKNTYYSAYYIEKDVSFYINNESQLMRLKNERYIHESMTESQQRGIINEDEDSSRRMNYYGTKEHIVKLSKYFTIEKLEKFNSIFKNPVKYPVDIVVDYRPDNTVDGDSMDEIRCNAYHLESISDAGMQAYADIKMCKYVLLNTNPEIGEELYDATISALTGVDVANGTVEPIVMLIKKIIESEDGYNKLNQIIRTYDVDGLIHTARENAILTENEMDPIKKLKRNITFKSHRGSEHLINAIKSQIEDKNDPTSELEKIKNQIAGATNVSVSTSSTPKETNTNTEEMADVYKEQFGEDFFAVTEDYIKMGNCVTYFTEANDPMLQKILYKERLRNNKALFPIYDEIKQKTNIRTTFVNYKKYKGYNLYVDLFYYNQLFFKNNYYKGKRECELYKTFLEKMFDYSKTLQGTAYENAKKTIIIPVLDWASGVESKMWMYTKDVNPISVIYDMMKKDVSSLKQLFGDAEVIFLGDTSYFKINFVKKNLSAPDVNKFLIQIRKMLNNEKPDIEDDGTDTTQVIIDKVLDRIEDSEGIKVSNLTGEAPEIKTEEDRVKKEINDKIIDKVETVAKTEENVDNAIETLGEDEYLNNILVSLASEEENGVDISVSREKRMSELQTNLRDKTVKDNTTVADLLNQREMYNEEELEKVSLGIDSINPEWQELVYPSLAQQYSPDADIVAMIYSLADKSYPIATRNISIDDTSTSENALYTYTVELENHLGKRNTLKFDIPKLKTNQYMVLGGNKKTISTQSFLLPISNTEYDTVQIISNYNKIFVRNHSTGTGKSHPNTDRLVKSIKKYKGNKIRVINGDNLTICNKYELPNDYIDLAGSFTKFETPNIVFFFNQMEISHELGDAYDKNKLAIGIRKNKKGQDRIIYYEPHYDTVAQQIAMMLGGEDPDFFSIYESNKAIGKYSYSEASILAIKIPLILLAAYSIGLTKVLDRYEVSYEIVDSARSKRGEIGKNYGFIKYADGGITYRNDYRTCLLMEGLKECPTELTQLADINKRSTYVEYLDNFGGRIKADGIDNFEDCLIDPITASVLKYYKLPEDYVGLLLHSNTLLVDNKFVKHTNMSGRRLRRNELIAAYTYKALSTAYGQYATSMKHGRETVLSMKQSAVIDLILADPTAGDLSIINALNEKESYDAVSTKGLSGLNTDRGYSLDKRGFDKSMLNVLGMSTGFAGTVGVNRQATLNASVSTVRGYVKPSDESQMNSINSLCMSEALTPMGTTRDDPFRSAMTFIQTTKHGIRVNHADPLLVTNGADQALPYLISDMFAFKAKEDGEIVEKVEDEYMIVKYKSGQCEYIDLSEKTEKNSSSGFYVVLKLSSDLKVGQKVKKGSLLAYDKSSFNDSVGINKDPAYKIGTLAKCAMLDTDEGFEDSAIISESLSEAMTSDIVVLKEINLDKNANVYNLLPSGTPVEEGDTLLVVQSTFDEDDANLLLKNLVDDEEEITNLGRVPIKAKATGVIQEIQIRRTCEIEEMSESLQKLCKKYEAGIKSTKKIMDKYDIDQKDELEPDYKLNATGSLNSCPDGVQIKIYMKYVDKMSVGDKLIYWSANKGVVKSIFPEGDEPYALSRPNEKLHSLLAIASVNGRMVTSIQNIGICNRLLIETARKAKDICGIKYKENLL